MSDENNYSQADQKEEVRGNRSLSPIVHEKEEVSGNRSLSPIGHTDQIKNLIKAVSVVSQIVALALILKLVVSINTSSYMSLPPTDFFITICHGLGISKFYDVRLLETITRHGGFIALFLCASYLTTYLYLELFFQEMTWNHKCLSAALWHNVFLKSFNFISFPGCNTACIGRSITSHRSGIDLLTKNIKEQNISHLQLAVCAIGLFMFLFLIKIPPIELALFSILALYLLIHEIFESSAIHYLRSKS